MRSMLGRSGPIRNEVLRCSVCLLPCHCALQSFLACFSSTTKQTRPQTRGPRSCQCIAAWLRAGPKPHQERGVSASFNPLLGWGGFPFSTTIPGWSSERHMQAAARVLTSGSYMTSFTSSVSADAGANTYLLFALVSLYFSIVFPWLGNSRSPSKSGPISSRLGLPSLWILSQSLFGILMLGTPFTTSPLLVSVLFAGAGISWAIGLWAPLAMFSTEIVKLQESSQEKSVVEALQHGESQAGVSMSLYNFALSAPQIVAAGICSTVFWLAEGPDLHGSIRLALMLGGCSSLVAAGLIGILLL